ncbi:MAG: winged helix DNA-binding domain-containing protein [Anaerolineae bacterium]|nr:winged helix DNA-binding domain-containing protein [Anaerolineae bacterium]
MADSPTKQEIERQRDWNYHRTPDRRLHTPEQALDFVNQVGFCHFWPNRGTELPNLFQAIAGRAREVPRQHDDPDISKCWGWKDQALDRRQWYYGKLLRRRATLVSLEMLPFFYAASENLGEVDDYLEEYEAGQMTAEAKWVCEALLEEGPLDTLQLRKKAGLSSSDSKSRFDRALVELQVGLKVLPIGVARVGRWRYAFTYELLLRHLPELSDQARVLKRSEAQRLLIRRYLENVVGAERTMVKGVFHVLKWTPTEVERAISALLGEGVVREIQVDGLPAAQLVSLSLPEARA